MPNHDIIDGAIRNEIALHRYARGKTRSLLTLFERFDRAVARILRKMYRESLVRTDFQYTAMISAIKEKRRELFEEAGSLLGSSLQDVGEVEYKKEWSLLLGVLGLSTNMPDMPNTNGAMRTPFRSGVASAATVGQWLQSIQKLDFARIRDALLLSVSQGDSTDVVVSRVVGTKGRSFRDGVVARTRNNVRALTTSAINHVSQWMREGLWRKIPQVAGMVWVSILDMKTTAICRARDGKVVMFGGVVPEGFTLLQPAGARPPAHPNCRSRMVAIIVGRETLIRESFDEFIRAQTPANQNTILGVTKAEMFRRGEVTLDGFVDETGQELTLDQLRST